MADENNQPQEQNPQANGIEAESVILKEYQKLQAESVSKDKYEADIKREKDRADLYLKAITEGRKVDTPTDNNSKSLNEMIAGLTKFKGTNLEYWQKMTPAIDKMLKEVPQSEIIKTVGQDGLEGIIRVNEGMKDMVEKSNGDPDYFRALYKKDVADASPRISAEIEQAGGLVNYLQNKK
jgi:hypothetical protein